MTADEPDLVAAHTGIGGQHLGLTAEAPPTLASHRLCAVPAGHDGLERDKAMATQLDITALETSFDLVAPKREELVDRFYRRMFTDAPATRALFAHAAYAHKLDKLY